MPSDMFAMDAQNMKFQKKIRIPLKIRMPFLQKNLTSSFVFPKNLSGAIEDQWAYLLGNFQGMIIQLVIFLLTALIQVYIEK